jgi:hypothetical protein
MTNEERSGETMGVKALMFALLAGTAFLFVAVTWSPVAQFAAEHHPVAQAQVHHDRVAAN